MTPIHKQSLRIVTRKNSWHKTIRRTVIAKSMVVAMLICMPVQATELASYSKPPSFHKASPGAVALTRNPLQDTHAEKPNAVNRNQRTAGSAPLSSAMVLSLAFGLRTATGPMVRTEKPEAKTASPSPKLPAANVTQAERTIFVPGQRGTPSAWDLSGRSAYQKLALEK